MQPNSALPLSIRARLHDEYHCIRDKDMIAARAAGWLGVQDRLVLAGVQVPPPPLRLMIVELARRSAIWARPVDRRVVAQVKRGSRPTPTSSPLSPQTRELRFRGCADRAHDPASPALSHWTHTGVTDPLQTWNSARRSLWSAEQRNKPSDQLKPETDKTGASLNI